MMQTKSVVRVLVADDQQLVRDGIASLLRIQEGIEVVGTATNGKEALEYTLALQPDVVLMDVRMPGMDGIEATIHIRRQLPRCRILMLTTFDDDDSVKDALQAGAHGYLLKDIPAADLALAVRAAAQNLYQFDPTIAGKVLSSFVASKKEEPPKQFIGTQEGELTERELDVLRLIATGATNKEIATALIISEGTVKNHISNMFSRLGFRDRTQAAMYARERGLL